LKETHRIFHSRVRSNCTIFSSFPTVIFRLRSQDHHPIKHAVIFEARALKEITKYFPEISAGPDWIRRRRGEGREWGGRATCNLGHPQSSKRSSERSILEIRWGSLGRGGRGRFLVSSQEFFVFFVSCCLPVEEYVEEENQNQSEITPSD
jgi:hypothetical protein